MDDLNELLNNCDGENPRIRHVYDAVMNKYTESGLSKLDEHTPSEAFFITYHLGSGLWLNDDLRNGLKLDTKCKQMFAAYLDEALEKIKSYSGIVYRMDDPNAEARHELDWFKKNIGKTICVPAYLSTSTERWDNQPVTWKIETLKTESFGKDISKLNKVEKEILFKRGSKFKIVGVDYNSSTIILNEVSSSSRVDINLVRDYTSR